MKKSWAACLLLPTLILLSVGPVERASAAITINVTSLGDGVADASRCPSPTQCRLRDAIADAASGDSINVSVSGTIVLSNGALAISKNLSISGPGPSALTVSGNQASQVVTVTGTANVSFVG